MPTPIPSLPITGCCDDQLESARYLAIRYTERLEDAGVVNSVGSRGDSPDNALAEAVNGLYKAGLIDRRDPWRSVEQVELETTGGVLSPAEREAAY